LVTGGIGLHGSHGDQQVRAARGHEPVIYDLRQFLAYRSRPPPWTRVWRSITDREALGSAPLHSVCDGRVAHFSRGPAGRFNGTCTRVAEGRGGGGGIGALQNARRDRGPFWRRPGAARFVKAIV